MSRRRTLASQSWRANRLRLLRFERHISQEELAYRLQIAQEKYGKWERGYYEPDDKMKKRIARVLRVSVEALTVAPESAAVAS